MTLFNLSSTPSRLPSNACEGSLSIEKMDEEKVVFNSKNIPDLPDLLNSDSAILLSTIMIEKRSNEYYLRKLFGPSFKGKYSGILQRLLNVGLLTRHLDGWLFSDFCDRAQYLNEIKGVGT